MPARYSGTPQATKLGIKPGQRLCLDDPPDDWSLTDAPSGVILVRVPEPADIVISFFRAGEELPVRLAKLAPRISPPVRSGSAGLAARADTAATSRTTLCVNTLCHSDWST